MKLFDVKSTGLFLGCSRQTVDRLIESGSLEAIPIRTGKRKRTLRISDAALKKFLGLRPGDPLVIEPAVVAEPKRREGETQE